MKYLLLTIILLTGCILEGPRGPAGAAGPAGESGRDGESASLSLYEKTGVLYSGSLTAAIVGPDYWNITIPDYGDQIIVTVHVRPGAGHMWVEPLWYLSTMSNYVRIFDNALANPADEYRIIVGY